MLHNCEIKTASLPNPMLRPLAGEALVTLASRVTPGVSGSIIVCIAEDVCSALLRTAAPANDRRAPFLEGGLP